jgi:hypothetical protein
LAAEGGHDTVLQFLVDHPQTPADAIDILDNDNVRLNKSNYHEFYVDFCSSVQHSIWLAIKGMSSVLVFFSEKELRSHTLAMALLLMRKSFRAVS